MIEIDASDFKWLDPRKPSNIDPRVERFVCDNNDHIQSNIKGNYDGGRLHYPKEDANGFRLNSCGKYASVIYSRVCVICHQEFIKAFSHPNYSIGLPTCWDCVNKYTFPLPKNWMNRSVDKIIVPPLPKLIIRKMTEEEKDRAVDDMFAELDTVDFDFS
jgi:hypothetical protein